MIVMRLSERQTQLVYDACNFSKTRDEIIENEDLFAGEYEQDFRQNFAASPFKDSPTIVLRMSFDEIEMDGDEPTEDELLLHLKVKGLTSLQAFDTKQYAEMEECYRAVSWLAQELGAEQIGRVMVARLVPGGHVLAHKDYGPYHDHYDRFHLCIGGEGCLFRCGKETVKMLPGEVWWFHNNDEHEVWNESDVARDHIIVDLKLRGDKSVHRTGGASTGVH